MKNISIQILVIFSLFLSSSCTKEVTIDIPGYEEMLVIDGRIETNQPPIVLISTSKEVYSPTDLNTFLNGFVSGASITVSDGSTSVVLDEFCSDNLPPGSETIVAALLGIPENELTNYHICGYTSLNPAIWGQVGKTYDLKVEYNGKTYTSSTTIMNPTHLNNVFWKPDEGYTDRGYSWASLTDPVNQFDAYKWEVKRIATDSTGAPVDNYFKPTYSPVIDDEFFDGLTFDFYYENPFAHGPEVPEDERYYYMLGDTVVIKFSKMDRDVYEYMEKKYTQLATAGNPFATPTNIPSNIEGGALGVWAGYSPTFDTLICVP